MALLLIDLTIPTTRLTRRPGRHSRCRRRSN